MSKTRHSHHPGGPDGDGDHRGFHRPYWKHAHHDWRLVVAVLLMLVAVATYVMTDNLALRPRNQRQQAPASAIQK